MLLSISAEGGGPSWFALLVFVAGAIAIAFIYGGPSEPRNP